MDKTLRTTLYCFLTFPIILSALQKIESNPHKNIHRWNFNHINENNLVFNKSKIDLSKRSQPRGGITIITECCQSIEEIIQPKGGVSKSGRILELYRDENSTQSFYQISCKEKGKRCARFGQLSLSKAFIHRFQCVQKYSFTYALVREFTAPETFPWRMDYIRLRNGCSCERIK